jgi:hypothetical protein
VLIEQAVFTSAKTDRAQGYQLLSRSPNLTEADAREISVWAPSHGSLLEQAGECSSANFFQLTSGSFCVSRTTRAGAEYSGRGESIYTQFLVVPPDVLAKFANNPFAILRAAAASGALCVHDVVPDSLEPLHLGGRAPVVDLGLMAQLARDPGSAAIATLVQAALASDRLAVSADASCEQLIAGLFNVLPVECRSQFSFSTGLIQSPSRPVRLSALPADESSWRAVGRQGITLLRLETNTTPEVGWEGWAAWIAGILSSGKLSVLAAELEQSRPGLSCGDLGKLGEDLQTALRDGHARPQAKQGSATPAKSPRKPKRRSPSITQRADQAHPAHQSGVLVEGASRATELDTLAKKLSQQPAEILEMLERIDDLVFAAISGDTQALAELEVLWPLTAAELEPDLVEQTREQYLRCALSICSDFAEGEVRRPERALAAVDVLCVLFEE